MTAALKEHLADERIWTIAARVAPHDGETSHYEVNGEGQISISVHTLRHGVQVRALMLCGDGSGKGVWKIPAVGTEVMLACDDGQFEGDVFIVGFFGKPGALGLSVDETIVADDMVYVGQKTASEKMVKGETYRSAEDALFTALKVVFIAINAYAVGIKPVADPSNAFTGVLTTALTTTFQGDLATFNAAASTYLAQKGKVF